MSSHKCRSNGWGCISLLWPRLPKLPGPFEYHWLGVASAELGIYNSEGPLRVDHPLSRTQAKWMRVFYIAVQAARATWSIWIALTRTCKCELVIFSSVGLLRANHPKSRTQAKWMRYFFAVAQVAWAARLIWIASAEKLRSNLGGNKDIQPEWSILVKIRTRLTGTQWGSDAPVSQDWSRILLDHKLQSFMAPVLLQTCINSSDYSTGHNCVRSGGLEFESGWHWTNCWVLIWIS